MNSLLRRLGLATLSALLVWPFALLELWLDRPPVLGSADIGDVLAGAAFGGLVLAPTVTRRGFLWGRRFVMVVLGALIYALAIELALDLYRPLDGGGDFTQGVLAASLVGVLLAGLAATQVGDVIGRPTLFPWLILVGVGAGLVFAQTFESNDTPVVLAGFWVWQVGLALALWSGTRQREA